MSKHDRLPHGPRRHHLVNPLTNTRPNTAESTLVDLQYLHINGPGLDHSNINVMYRKRFLLAIVTYTFTFFSFITVHKENRVFEMSKMYSLVKDSDGSLCHKLFVWGVK